MITKLINNDSSFVEITTPLMWNVRRRLTGVVILLFLQQNNDSSNAKITTPVSRRRQLTGVVISMLLQQNNDWSCLFKV